MRNNRHLLTYVYRPLSSTNYIFIFVHFLFFRLFFFYILDAMEKRVIDLSNRIKAARQEQEEAFAMTNDLLEAISNLKVRHVYNIQFHLSFKNPILSTCH